MIKFMRPKFQNPTSSFCAKSLFPTLA